MTQGRKTNTSDHVDLIWPCLWGVAWGVVRWPAMIVKEKWNECLDALDTLMISWTNLIKPIATQLKPPKGSLGSKFLAEKKKRLVLVTYNSLWYLARPIVFFDSLRSDKIIMNLHPNKWWPLKKSGKAWKMYCEMPRICCQQKHRFRYLQPMCPEIISYWSDTPI